MKVSEFVWQRKLGPPLVGVIYVLDEPISGFHQRDNERLIGTLERLRDLGNTVLVVEHSQDTMERADYLIDRVQAQAHLGALFALLALWRKFASIPIASPESTCAAKNPFPFLNPQTLDPFSRHSPRGRQPEQSKVRKCSISLRGIHLRYWSQR